MRKRYALLALFFPLAGLCQKTVIRHVSVIDVKNGKTIPGQTVVLDGEQIALVTSDSKAKIPEDAQQVDGTGKFLMPGMTDAHIHFFQSGGLYTRPDVIDLRKRTPYEKEQAFGMKNTGDYLHRYLRCGITTVIDVGGPFSNFTIRDSVAPATWSPNVLVTGPLFSMVNVEEFKGDKPIIQIQSTAAADSLFDRMMPYKPDFIKVWYIAEPSMPAQKNFALVKYIADKTHQSGLKLTVHATELETAKLAVEAGADILVHSVDDAIIPDEELAKWKQRKVTYIPTLIVGSNYYRVFSGKLVNDPQDLAWANPFAYGTLTDPEAMTDAEMPFALKMLRKSGIPARAHRSDSISALNLVRVYRAGINVVTGTDAGNIGTQHASSFYQELKTMQAAGMDNASILKAATINAAAGFGKDRLWGSVEKGKKADLLLLAKNPLDSLSFLNSLEKLFKNGKMFSADSLLVPSAEEVVQQQLNAYNAHDIDAFLATYDDDVELADFGAKETEKGKAGMRNGYGKFFQETPDLYCQITNRMVIGNKVIDYEKVRVGGKYISAIAIYEVRNGKIIKVTFIQ